MSVESILKAIAENPKIVLADLVSTLEDKAWRRGWVIGVVAGAFGAAACYALREWIGGM